MSNFNYFKGGAWSNPARVVEKTTNEMPEAEKAKTTTKKAKKPAAKKKAAKKTNK